MVIIIVYLLLQLVLVVWSMYKGQNKRYIYIYRILCKQNGMMVVSCICISKIRLWLMRKLRCDQNQPLI